MNEIPLDKSDPTPARTEPAARPAPEPAVAAEPEPEPAPAPAARSGGGVADHVRVSDADRDRVAEILREALAEGRLTAEEHAERVEAAYGARTAGQLEPLVRDLPAGRRSPAAPVRLPPVTAVNVVAVFSGATRKGRWRPGRRTTAFVCFGGVELDLTEALFEHRETVIQATAIFGGIDIVVPENVTLRNAGSGVMGGFDVEVGESEDPDAPVVVIRGFALFGGVDAKAKKGRRIRDLRSPRD